MKHKNAKFRGRECKMKHKNAKTLTVSLWATHRQIIKELEKVWRYNGRSPVVQRALEDAYNRVLNNTAEDKSYHEYDLRKSNSENLLLTCKEIE